MNIPETYDYLARARRDLWATLEAVPDHVLSKPLLSGDRFRCIKDLVWHTAEVEDGWLHGDIQRVPPVQDRLPEVQDLRGRPFYDDVPLASILDYWRAVEESTRAYLTGLDEAELGRVVTVEDWPPEHQRFTLDGLLWHVLMHEVRHTAQIAVLLRTQEIKPPSLDLLFYLPSVPSTRSG
ncbi:DinB family protein [Deinococcus apachensis]|uniref:DinB family protein n=1 Tax=Deinococcus apachensis TaxID=309886 RepID=UPI00037F333C|nr:DinB family protein [Deinococcus apachensis]